jgi:hypothetical protein
MPISFRTVFNWNLSAKQKAFDKIYVLSKSFRKVHENYLAAKCSRRFVDRKNKKVD